MALRHFLPVSREKEAWNLGGSKVKFCATNFEEVPIIDRWRRTSGRPRRCFSLLLFLLLLLLSVSGGQQPNVIHSLKRDSLGLIGIG